MNLPLLVPRQDWHCEMCGAEDVTNEAEPHTRFHACHRLGGLTAPMVMGKARAKVTLNEREDYVGSEDVTMVNGRPIMNVTTEYADGRTSVAVYAPTAHGGAEAYDKE